MYTIQHILTNTTQLSTPELQQALQELKNITTTTPRETKRKTLATLLIKQELTLRQEQPEITPEETEQLVELHHWNKQEKKTTHEWDINEYTILDDKGKPQGFNYHSLASDINKHHQQQYRTDEFGHLHYYQKGKYYRSGKEQLQEWLAKEFSNCFNIRKTAELLHMIRSITRTPHNEYDKDANILNVNNGLLNIKTGKLKQHTANYPSKKQLQVQYDPKEKCPRWKQFIKEITGNEADPLLLQELSGYTLLNHHKHQIAAILLGSGANGKSVFLSITEYILGEQNVCSIPVQDINKNRFAKARLYGKMANLVTELPDTKLMSTGVFKKITGGDLIDAEIKLQQESLKFRSTAVNIFATNTLFQTDDVSRGFFRRWLIILFPNNFEDTANIHLEEELREESSGILNWMIEGANRLESRGRFVKNQTTKDIELEWIRETNPALSFIHDCMGYTKGLENDVGVYKYVVHQAFLKYRNSLGVKCSDESRWFWKELRKGCKWPLKEYRSVTNDRARLLKGWHFKENNYFDHRVMNVTSSEFYSSKTMTNSGKTPELPNRPNDNFSPYMKKKSKICISKEQAITSGSSGLSNLFERLSKESPNGVELDDFVDTAKREGNDQGLQWFKKQLVEGAIYQQSNKRYTKL